MASREIEFTGSYVVSDDGKEVTLKLPSFVFAEAPTEPEPQPDPIEAAVPGGRFAHIPHKVTGLSSGRAIPHNDGTLLDLRAVTAATTLTADIAGLSGGTTFHVSEIAQKRGWATGAVYMLETDADGDLVLEQDEGDRQFFIAHGGLTRYQIAEREGIAAKKVNAKWITASQYGRDPETALDAQFGADVWAEVTQNHRGDNLQSHHLRLKRGGDYRGVTFGNNRGWLSRGICGRSRLNPCAIRSYGEGDLPLIGHLGAHPAASTWNIVIDGVRQEGYGGNDYLAPGRILFSDIESTWAYSVKGDVNSDFFFYRTSVHDVHRERPVSGAETWEQESPNRISGVYGASYGSFGMWQVALHHNGYSPLYDTDNIEALSAEDPMPPSYYNHNAYLQWDFREMNLIDVFTSFAASQGIQNRAGGHYARIVSVANGLAFNNMAGSRGADDEWHGLFGNFLWNVVTQAGYPYSANYQGAINWGPHSEGYDDSWLGNLIVNHIDPNNAAELERHGGSTGPALKLSEERPPVYNNTKIIWGEHRENVTPEDLETAKRTTIQIFAEKTIGRKVTVREFCDWLSKLPAKRRVKIQQACWRFFQEAFGNIPPERTTNGLLRFIPDWRSDGFRWDNEANFDSKDLPIDGDSVDASGLYTTFQMRTLRLASANLQDGIVDFVSGKLYVADAVNGATLRAMNCGQWEGHGASDFEVSDGARITIAGPSSGDVVVKDEGEFRFGPDFTVPSGKALTLIGGGCRAGWAGQGVLDLHGPLELLAVNGALPQLQALNSDASGVVRLHPGFTVRGDLTPGHAITGEGVRVENHGADLPASVTLAGGRLTVS